MKICTDGLKRGDYFDFTLSSNVNTYGVSTARKVPEIKNGSVVSAGEILGNGNIRYTFTNEIEHKVEVEVNLNKSTYLLTLKLYKAMENKKCS